MQVRSFVMLDSQFISTATGLRSSATSPIVQNVGNAVMGQFFVRNGQGPGTNTFTVNVWASNDQRDWRKVGTDLAVIGSTFGPTPFPLVTGVGYAYLFVTVSISGAGGDVSASVDFVLTISAQ